MCKNLFLIIMLLPLLFCLSSYKSLKSIPENPTKLILGKWKVDSFYLYTTEDFKIDTSSNIKSLDYSRIFSKTDLKEIGIYGLRLKLNQKIQFSKEQTVYGSKIRFNKKQYRTSTNFKIKGNVLSLFHKEGNSGHSEYVIKTLSSKKLVFEGDFHTGGCYGYRGTVFCSKK